MNTFKQVYTERKTYSQFDKSHFVLYLNEEVINDYIPETNEGELESCTGYSYEGSEKDGGTIIEAIEASYDTFVAGLIRKRYTMDAESAIQSNMIVALSDPKNPRAVDFENEWNEFQEYRILCKSQASKFFQL